MRAVRCGVDLPLVGQGVAYSIYASSLWPTVQATVMQHEVGMAYGVVTAVQNGGLALFPYIVPTPKEESGFQECMPNLPRLNLPLYPGIIHDVHIWHLVARTQVGTLRASLKAYAPGVEVFFSALAGVGVLTGFCLYVTDKTQLGGKLEYEQNTRSLSAQQQSPYKRSLGSRRGS